MNKSNQPICKLDIPHFFSLKFFDAGNPCIRVVATGDSVVRRDPELLFCALGLKWGDAWEMNAVAIHSRVECSLGCFALGTRCSSIGSSSVGSWQSCSCLRLSFRLSLSSRFHVRKSWYNKLNDFPLACLAVRNGARKAEALHLRARSGTAFARLPPRIADTEIDWKAYMQEVEGVFVKVSHCIHVTPFPSGQCPKSGLFPSSFSPPTRT